MMYMAEESNILGKQRHWKQSVEHRVKEESWEMAGGGFASGPSERAHLYEYRITAYFIFACIVAALGGSLFGYDLGVSGHFFFFFH